MIDHAATGAGAETARAAPTSLKAAADFIPEACYARPLWRGLAVFARDLAIYAAAVALLLGSETPLVLVPAWLLAGAAMCGLFVIGHDAAHGALFRSPRLCRVVGQIAFLPSLHALAVWALGHNRVHHVHTGCADIDFVWRPLTPDSYARLPPLRRLQHRFEWSAWGAGAYYLRIVWWQRMLRAQPPPRLRAAFRRDRAIVCAYAVSISALLLWVGYARTASVAGALWTWCKVFAVPWLVFSQVIGTVVYVQHIAPDIAWWPRQRWRKLPGQIEGTASYHIPAWLNFFWHNILLHVAHHVDPRIPFYHLPAAVAALARRYPDVVRVRRLRWRDYRHSTRTCKLYDFDRAAWVGYDRRPAARRLEDAA
jgi:omega-6 fatty acid desaturase (delta-12 desaturase)